MIILKKITKDEFEQLYKQGLSDSDISEKYGLSKNYVGNLRREYGFKRGYNHFKCYELSKEEMLEMYLELEMSDEQIANEKGLSRNYVTRLRKKYNIKARSTKNKEILTKEITDYLNKIFHSNGLTFSEESNIYYHYLINCRKVKIIYSKTFNVSHFRFKLTFPKNKYYKESENGKKQSRNRKRYKVSYADKCDFIIFVGLIYDAPFDFWVFKSSEIDSHLEEYEHISLGRNGEKYKNQYRNINIINEE